MCKIAQAKLAWWCERASTTTQKEPNWQFIETVMAIFLRSLFAATSTWQQSLLPTGIHGCNGSKVWASKRCKSDKPAVFQECLAMKVTSNAQCIFTRPNLERSWRHASSDKFEVGGAYKAPSNEQTLSQKHSQDRGSDPAKMLEYLHLVDSAAMPLSCTQWVLR